MLTHPTTDRLRELGLAGKEERRHPDAADLGFEDRLTMLVEREALERDTKRLATRLKFAGLRQQATPEDVDHRAARLNRALFQKLTSGEWIERPQDLLVTGPTGTGKTWLSCALSHRACRDNRSVLYPCAPRLLEALGIARGDGRYDRMLKSIARVQLLILDDWAITPFTAEQRRDLMETVDDRHDRASTIVTSPVPVELWHEHIGNPTIADAVLDRLVHGAHRLELNGESMRKLRAAKGKLDEAAVQKPNWHRSQHPTLPGWDHRNARLVSIGIDGCNRRNAQRPRLRTRLGSDWPGRGPLQRSPMKATTHAGLWSPLDERSGSGQIRHRSASSDRGRDCRRRTEQDARTRASGVRPPLVTAS